MARELLSLMMIDTEINGAPVKKLSQTHEKPRDQENRWCMCGSGLARDDDDSVCQTEVMPSRASRSVAPAPPQIRVTPYLSLLQIPAPVLLAHLAHKLAVLGVFHRQVHL